MEGFDREALIKSAGAKERNNTWFWGAVAILPVVGIAAGVALGFMPNGKDVEQPSSWAEIAPEAPAPSGQMRLAKTEPPPAVDTGASKFSAREQLQRYSMVTRTLRNCASVGPADHYSKALNIYYDANFEKTNTLRDLALDEPSEYDLSAFEQDIPTNPAEIMVKGMTGQIAMNALQRANQFETMMADMEADAASYRGKTLSSVECTSFRNEVIMGKHNLDLPVTH